MDLYNFFEYIRRLRVYSIDTDRGIERPGHTPLDGTMVWVRAVAGILHPFNHLARGNESVRRRQAGGLRKWAEAQSPPLLAIGDYNFDYDFHTQTGITLAGTGPSFQQTSRRGFEELPKRSMRLDRF